MNEIKVFVVGEATYYSSFIKGAVLTNKQSEADIVLFTGGEDVDPKLYGHSVFPNTYFNHRRDVEESKAFKKCKPSQLVVGICRGSQFLCVMNGGKLIQDVRNHALWNTHPILVNTNEIYEITSTHHQMQYPYNLDSKNYDIIATAYPPRSLSYMGDFTNDEISQVCYNGEPEIVVYHNEGMPKCLAIQGHPEAMAEDSPVVEMLNKLINTLLNNN